MHSVCMVTGPESGDDRSFGAGITRIGENWAEIQMLAVARTPRAPQLAKRVQANEGPAVAAG